MKGYNADFVTSRTTCHDISGNTGKRNCYVEVFSYDFSYFTLSVPCLLSPTHCATYIVFHHDVVHTTTTFPPPHCSSSDSSWGQILAHQCQPLSYCGYCDWHCSWLYVCVCVFEREALGMKTILMSVFCCLLGGLKGPKKEYIWPWNFFSNAYVFECWLNATQDFHRCTKTSKSIK